MRRISPTTGWYYTRLARARKPFREADRLFHARRARPSLAPLRFRSPPRRRGCSHSRARVGGPPAGRAPGLARAPRGVARDAQARRGAVSAGARAPPAPRARAVSSDTGFPPTGFPTRRRRRARHRSRACPGARRASARRATPARRRARGGRFRSARGGSSPNASTSTTASRPRGASRFDRLRLDRRPLGRRLTSRVSRRCRRRVVASSRVGMNAFAFDDERIDASRRRARASSFRRSRRLRRGPVVL